MDFYYTLSESEKTLCKESVWKIIEAYRAHQFDEDSLKSSMEEREMIGIIEKMIEATKSDLAHEKARGAHQNNLVKAIAAHKIEWLKELKREFENSKKPRQP